MQKATEHVIGCVMCSPGCFSLFRGSALLDEVMRKYAERPSKPAHYVQYDQGDVAYNASCVVSADQAYRLFWGLQITYYLFSACIVIGQYRPTFLRFVLTISPTISSTVRVPSSFRHHMLLAERPEYARVKTRLSYELLLAGGRCLLRLLPVHCKWYL